MIFLSNGFSLKLAPVPCAIPEWPIDFNPCRPIVSAWSCPTGNISAYLDHGVLVSFVKTLPTYVKDTNHALHIFDSFRFDTTDPGHRLVLFTIDVKSLYTVIPNNCGLQALTYLLDKREIKEPSTSTLTRIAELVLSLNSFSFNSEYYCQIGVVAMGCKMGPNYALINAKINLYVMKKKNRV